MPAGYTTYYGGAFEDLAAAQAAVAAQEEVTPEGTLVCLELTLSEPAPLEALVELNSRLLAAGVPPWEGYGSVVFADSAGPKKVYVAWTKGIAMGGIVIGILLFLLPTILGGLIWFLIPQRVKEMMIMMGFMAIMLPIMGMMR